MQQVNEELGPRPRCVTDRQLTRNLQRKRTFAESEFACPRYLPSLRWITHQHVQPGTSDGPPADETGSAMKDRSRSRTLLTSAAVLGIVHGGFSLYWALGGRWLLGTVGDWAIDWADRSPAVAAGTLLAVAAVKFVGAIAPVLYQAGQLPGPARVWKALFAAGAVLLMGYGALNTVGAWIGLAAGAESSAALVGNAALWDPRCFWPGDYCWHSGFAAHRAPGARGPASDPGRNRGGPNEARGQ